MTQGDNIVDLNIFLKSGAFVRLPGGRLHLWQGLDSCVDKEMSVFIQDFFSTRAASFRSQRQIQVPISALRAQLSDFLKPQASALSVTDFWAPQFSEFEKSFQIIQGKIHRGEIEKAVPIVFSKSKKTVGNIELASLLYHSLEAFDALYVYGWWHEGMGILGATPETLFNRQGDRLQSMALAGTCPRSELGKRPSLLKDSKELHEHNLVVKDIENKLAHLGWVRTEETKVVEFPTLLHLKTEIEVTALKVNCLELTKRMHPTAALGVSPQNYGIQWMKALPYQEERNLFGAPIIYKFSESEEISLVAIRNIQWNSDGCKVGAGCGLVSSSELEREWNELNAKIGSTLKILGLDR